MPGNIFEEERKKSNKNKNHYFALKCVASLATTRARRPATSGWSVATSLFDLSCIRCTFFQRVHLASRS